MPHRVNDTKVQNTHVLRQNIEVGKGNLRECHLVGVFAVVSDESVDVAQGGKAKLFEHTDKGL